MEVWAAVDQQQHGVAGERVVHERAPPSVVDAVPQVAHVLSPEPRLEADQPGPQQGRQQPSRASGQETDGQSPGAGPGRPVLAIVMATLTTQRRRRRRQHQLDAVIVGGVVGLRAHAQPADTGAVVLHPAPCTGAPPGTLWGAGSRRRRRRRVP
eukprot:COSAG01_NODE_1723_length_9381_cov_23.828611_6_plen_154_part_00